MAEYGLGRRPAYDQRDERYLIRNLAGVEPERKIRYWYDSAPFYDQGATSRCVEYGWHHWIAAGPVRPYKKAPYWEFGEVYEAAKKVDEWDGEDYDGTSVRAGAKVLQSLGYIESYLWAWNVDDLAMAVTNVGPVVIGTNWYSDMFEPDRQGVVHATGYNAGGHCTVVTGINRRTGLFRVKNSWSRAWGHSGRFWIPFEDMDRLIYEDGEACLAVESKGLITNHV